MTGAQVRDLSVVDRQEGPTGVVHFTCCEDENTAMCGRDITNDAWDTDEPDCPDCDAQDKALIPVDGECPGCPMATLRDILEGRR